jgi:glycerol uptake facilitator protein
LPALLVMMGKEVQTDMGPMDLGGMVTALGGTQFSDGIKPLVVGALVLAIGHSLGGTTGYAINPARDLGPRLVHALLPIPGKGGSDWGYAWIPVLAPIAGGICGALAYKTFLP